jgi:hypothetical protein
MGVPGEIRPLPPALDRINNRQMMQQKRDLWHPGSELSGLDWPADWPERF